eukprot:gene5664-6360_t
MEYRHFTHEDVTSHKRTPAEESFYESFLLQKESDIGNLYASNLYEVQCYSKTLKNINRQCNYQSTEMNREIEKVRKKMDSFRGKCKENSFLSETYVPKGTGWTPGYSRSGSQASWRGSSTSLPRISPNLDRRSLSPNPDWRSLSQNMDRRSLSPNLDRHGLSPSFYKHDLNSNQNRHQGSNSIKTFPEQRYCLETAPTKRLSKSCSNLTSIAALEKDDSLTTIPIQSQARTSNKQQSGEMCKTDRKDQRGMFVTDPKTLQELNNIQQQQKQDLSSSNRRGVSSQSARVKERGLNRHYSTHQEDLQNLALGSSHDRKSRSNTLSKNSSGSSLADGKNDRSGYIEGEELYIRYIPREDRVKTAFSVLPEI